jgi:hypothetical protein
MTPRPIYRWKSFWFGLCVLVFLGWAGVWSMHEVNTIAYKGSPWSPACIGYSRAGAFAILSSNNMLSLDFQGLWTGAFPTTDKPIWADWFPQPVRTGTLADGDHWHFKVAHWFLILLFLVPWASFLAWRWRRVKRITAGTAEPPARRSTS